MSGQGCKKHVSVSEQSGILFPVGRIHSWLKKGLFTERVGNKTAIYMAAVLEYIASEILELAGNSATDNKRQTITPRDIAIIMMHDEELNDLLKNAYIAQGGVMPHIENFLLPDKPKSKKKEEECE